MSGPLDSESERILLGLAADVQRPEIIWQVAVLLGCLLFAWYLGSRLRVPALRRQGWRLGSRRVLFPLSAFLLASIEQIRGDVREGFSQSVSGTDLIVGPRTGSTQLLLYSVFRIGQPTNNMRWDSVEALTARMDTSIGTPLCCARLSTMPGTPPNGPCSAYCSAGLATR